LATSSEKPMLIIAVTGMPGSGKSTVSKALSQELSAPLFVMGDLVRDEVVRRGLPLTAENIEQVATELRSRHGRGAVGVLLLERLKVYIPRGTVIEDNVFLGPNVVITNDKYPPSKRLDGVKIRRGAVIGANATLIAGIEIGENSVVAAGSVVTKDVPPGKVVAGVPAKPIYDVEVFMRKRVEYESQTP